MVIYLLALFDISIEAFMATEYNKMFMNNTGSTKPPATP
jgi:hypothetical protein